MKIVHKGILPILLVSSFLSACNDENNTNITVQQPASSQQIPEISNTQTPNPPPSKPDYLESSLYDINEENLSPNQDNRQMFLILHYTAVTKQRTLELFNDPTYPASSHYLIPELPESNGKFTVYRLVPDNKRAWHTGASSWQTNASLNASSIGIEIENLGFPEADENKPLMLRSWYPYSSKEQIKVLADVILKVTQKYDIRADRILGHSDIAPGRKTDPGPLFPWEELYNTYNIGTWYDYETVNYYRLNAPWNGDVKILQNKLASYGYNISATGEYNQVTQNVVSAFQMHFYPQKYDGIADVETVARLDALLEKYRAQQRPSS